MIWRGLIFLFVLAACESKEQREYFDSLDLKLSGTIQSIDMPYGFNDFGILKVSIISSNISWYDPRKKLDHYYCIIKNNLAEIYQFDLNNCDIGDTIEVNTLNRLFLVHKKNSILLYKRLALSNDELFFKYIRKHHQDF